MHEIIKKSVIYVELEDLTSEFILEFFLSEKGGILIVYKRGDFVASITYEDILRSRLYLNRTDAGVEKCIELSCHYETEADGEMAERLYSEGNVKSHYILIKENEKNNIRQFFDMNPVCSIEKLNKYYNAMREDLRNCGVYAYIVSFDRAMSHINGLTLQHDIDSPIMYINENEESLKKIIKKITEKSYDEARRYAFSKKVKPVSYGNHSKTIFLVEPCVVGGGANPDGEDLAEILYGRVSRYGYNVKRVVMTNYEKTIKRTIFEEDIKKNDIVIMLNYIVQNGKADVDTEEMFLNETGEELLYQTIPMHTTVYGNKKLTELLVDKIILSVWGTINENDNYKIIYKGRRQFSWLEEKQITDYLKPLRYFKDRNGRFLCGEQKIGCVVMNCNPFTKGHLHLIETASKSVDFLFVFVVEEDASYFPFKDRFAMVKEGTAHIENIVVEPSGQFILSRATFQDYFEKEVVRERTDASVDLDIFANYIAPALGITKRFVGEEPFDITTRRYNEAMKELLPKANIEVVEIPRISAGGKVVSATSVRKLLTLGNWDTASLLLPETSVRYLREHLERIERERTKKAHSLQIQESELLKSHKVAVYGCGRWGKAVIEKLQSYDVEIVCIIDRKLSGKIYDSYPNSYPIISVSEVYKYDFDDVIIASIDYAEQMRETIKRFAKERERQFNIHEIVISL